MMLLLISSTRSSLFLFVALVFLCSAFARAFIAARRSSSTRHRRDDDIALCGAASRWSTRRLFLSSTNMPYDDGKMPFYAFGANLALQVGGGQGPLSLASILKEDEMEIALEAFCAYIRSGTDTTTPQQRQQHSSTILATYGPQIRTILGARTSQIIDGIKQEGQAFVADFVESHPAAVATDSGLVYLETTAGTGASPTVKDSVEVHYHATLTDGTVVDSSLEGGQPYSIPLNGVIPGWMEGLQLMKEGGKATFVIPPNLAYGDGGLGGVVPPGATLKYEVDLFKVVSSSTSDESESGESEVFKLPDGTKVRVPKGVKVRLVDEEK